MTAENDSADRRMTANGCLCGSMFLWVCGGSAALFVSTQAITWALATLRMWYLVTLSTMFLSSAAMAEVGSATQKSNTTHADEGIYAIRNSDTPARPLSARVQNQ